MKEVLIWLAGVIAITAVAYWLLYPYYSLGNLKNIAEELEKIRKAIEDKKATE